MRKLYRHSIFFMIILSLGFIGCSKNSKGNPAAIEAALTWVSLVDSGDYGMSWEAASSYFKNAVPKENWQQSLIAVRKPLGELISRDVKSAQYKTALPGAPDGEYVIIEFESSFENKESALETITPMLEGDNVWRVSGYFIK